MFFNLLSHAIDYKIRPYGGTMFQFSSHTFLPEAEIRPLQLNIEFFSHITQLLDSPSAFPTAEGREFLQVVLFANCHHKYPMKLHS